MRREIDTRMLSVITYLVPLGAAEHATGVTAPVFASQMYRVFREERSVFWEVIV
jgi:hypothetical protein